MTLLAVLAGLYGLTTMLYLVNLVRWRPHADQDCPTATADSRGLLDVLLGHRRSLERWASLSLEITFLVHTVALAFWIGIAVQQEMPTLIAALPIACWGVVAGYLVLEARFHLSLLGSLVVPLITILLLVSLAAVPDHPRVPLAMKGPALTVHVLGALLGLGAFLLAAVLSAFYLMLEKQLKSKRFGQLYQRLPALATMDRLIFRCILTGFPIYTLAVVIGGLSAYQEKGFGKMGDAYLLAVLTWLLYSIVLQGRITAGWRGRRASYLILVGLFASILVLIQFLVQR